MRSQPIVLLLVLSFCVLVGCGDDEPEMGQVRVSLTDAPYPFDMIEDASLLIDEVSVRVQTDDGEASGWYDVDHAPQTYDLMDLQQGVVAVLGEVSVPVGEIRQFRVVIREASISLKDGRSFDLQVPSGASSGLKVFPAPPIRVASGLTSEVLLDADVAESFKSLPASPRRMEDITGFQFSPLIRAANLTTSGSIAGAVFSDSGTTEPEDDFPLDGATVMAFATSDTMTTATDALGMYEILGLEPGAYTVEASKLGFSSASALAEVVAGNLTSGIDLVLTPTP